jgi:hypothetical protein
MGERLCRSNFVLRITFLADIRKVFQEFASARKAMFLYGAQCITRDVLSIVLQLFTSSYASMLVGSFDEDIRKMWILEFPTRNRVKHILEYRHSMPSYRDLRTLLTHSRRCETSDKRDHIYAFLGLATYDYGLQADYSSKVTPEAVFTQLTRRIIETDRDLHILGQVRLRPYKHNIEVPIQFMTQIEKRLDNLPSWVPDWSADKTGSPFKLSSAIVWEGNRNLLIQFTDALFLDDGRTLDVSGIFIDTVTEVSQATCRASAGYCFLDTGSSAIGDQIWKLQGARVLVVLRADGMSFQFVTECSIDPPPHSSITPGEASIEHYIVLMAQNPVRLRII